MHHIQVLIELVAVGTLSSAITYGICAWPLRVENAKLKRELRRSGDSLSRAIERHQRQDEEARLQRMIEGVSSYTGRAR